MEARNRHLLLFGIALLLQGACQPEDERILWASPSGIFIVHTGTAVVDTVRYTPCENLNYSFTSVSPDKEKTLILTSRREYRYEGSDSLFFYRELALIDMDTDEEWIVNFE